MGKEYVYLSRRRSELGAKLAGDGGPVETGGTAVSEDDQEKMFLCRVVPVDAVAIWLAFRHGRVNLNE